MNRENFGELIKELRKKNDLTQAELAKILHVTTGAVSKWELEKAFPNVNTQKDICRFFGLLHDDLHHPITAIEKLRQTETQMEFKEMIAVEETVTEKQNVKQKLLWRKKIFISVGIAMVVIIGIISVVLFLGKKSNEIDFIPVGQEYSKGFTYYYFQSRYIYDEYLGEEVYERSCIFTGTYMPEIVECFKEEICKEWLEDSSLRQDINALKLSFYSTEQDALNWDDTEYKFYLFRN